MPRPARDLRRFRGLERRWSGKSHEAGEGAEGEGDECQWDEAGGEDAVERGEDGVVGDAQDEVWIPEAQFLRVRGGSEGVAVEEGGCVGGVCDALGVAEEHEGACGADED